MYLMKLYFTIKKALPNRQCTSFHATGCHFTGPVALRPRLSSGLPNILLKLLNSSENIDIIILPYSTVRKQNHTVLMLLMLLKRRIIEIDQDSILFSDTSTESATSDQSSAPHLQTGYADSPSPFSALLFPPCHARIWDETPAHRFDTELRCLSLSYAPAPADTDPAEGSSYRESDFSGPCRNYASSMPRLPCNRASVLRPPGNNSISRRCRGCLTATDTASESAYCTACNGRIHGGRDLSAPLCSADASPHSR